MSSNRVLACLILVSVVTVQLEQAALSKCSAGWFEARLVLESVSVSNETWPSTIDLTQMSLNQIAVQADASEQDTSTPELGVLAEK